MAQTRRALLGTLGAMGAVGLAGCAGGESGAGAQDTTTTTTEATTTTTTTTAEPTTTTTTEAMAATVAVASTDEYGDVLVDADGMTLYMFDRDTQGEAASVCYDQCEENWPPLLADAPSAGDGVSASLSTFEREDGSMQVAANGWPLYYFAGDSAAGDTNGQALGDVWWVLDPAGEPIRGSMTTTESDDGGDGPGDY